MDIQWYPGHMNKAKKEVEEQLKKVDMVIELADARVPMSSRNPMLEKLTGQKPRLIVLTKQDMADETVTSDWIKWFKENGDEAVAINALSNRGKKPIIQASKDLTTPLFEKMKRKGMRPRSIRAMIIGIPNVGKSTVINRLVGKKSAKTGDKPGVTKAQQWLKVGKEMELLDTPGILWPKFEDQSVGYRLAATGAIKDDLLDFQELAVFTLRILIDRYEHRLAERYGMDQPITKDSLDLLDTIGEKRGCLMAGGIVDRDKAAELFIREVRRNKLGPISFETPQDWNEN